MGRRRGRRKRDKERGRERRSYAAYAARTIRSDVIEDFQSWGRRRRNKRLLGRFAPLR